ncbi:unnamed protein product, partial [Symbiodinium pilosum]
MASWSWARVLALYVTCTSAAFGTGRIHGQLSSAPIAGLADLELPRAEEASSLLQMRNAANQTRETSGPSECWATLAKHQERSGFLEVLKPLTPELDALWQKRLELARKTPPKRTLVIFAGHFIPPGSDKEKIYMENLRYFLKYGACHDKFVTTLVVVGRKANVSALIEANLHVTWLQRSPYCYDFEAYKVGLKHIGAKRLRNYDHFVFLNCGLAGPFLPSAALAEPIHWSRYFTSHITSKVKLVGLSFNFVALPPMYSHNTRVPHVMSMILATDHAGLKVLIRHMEHGLNIDMFSGPAIDDLNATVDWPTRQIQCRVANPSRGDFVKMSPHGFINNLEVALSQSMFDSGYSIAAVSRADFGTEISSRYGPEKSHGDLLLPGAYLNNSTIGPFDAIFVKTSRLGLATPQ